MFNLGPANENKMGLEEKKNKYEIKNYKININEDNDSHSVIAKEILKDKRNIKVLDIGCGSGVIGECIASDSVIVDGVEIDDNAIAAALNKKKYRNIYNFSIESLSIDELKRKLDTYDYIILADLLEHLYSPDNLLKKILHLLNKDGNILISIPNVSHVSVIKDLVNNKFNYNFTGILDTTHLRFYTLPSFLKMIQNINKELKEKIDVELISTTKGIFKDIDRDSKLFQILNVNNNSEVIQYILKANIVHDNTLTLKLDNLINKKEYNVFNILENNLKENYEIEYEKEKEILIDKLKEAEEDMKLFFSDNQAFFAENSQLHKELNLVKKENDDLKNLLNITINSRSWKITKPLRNINAKLRNLKSNLKSDIIEFNNSNNNDNINYVPIVDENKSDLKTRLTITELFDVLNEYDIVSFDMFDTLVFRPFVNPTDLFDVIGMENSIDSFKTNRINAEKQARLKSKNKNNEVNIYEIYHELEKISNIGSKSFIKKELEAEKKFCYANPYMKQVINKLLENGKKVVVTSDMYWPKEFLKEILVSCGYDCIDDIYVSCEYGYGKFTGMLQKMVDKDNPNKNIIHIGDNYESDIIGSKKNGWDTYYYQDCKSVAIQNGETIYDDSLINSVLSSIKYNYLYCGDSYYSKYYKYGFNYAGVLVCGFLENVNKIVEAKKIDKIFFLARDCKILYEIYNKYFYKKENDYVVVSRCAMYEIMFEEKIENFCDFYFTSRAQMNKYSIEESLLETDMEILLPLLKKYKINGSDILNDSNIDKLKTIIYENKQEIIKYFSSSKKAAVNYYSNLIQDTSKILAVDLGWSGTIVTLLDQFLTNNINKNIELYGMFIGNADSKKVNALIDFGKFESYAFSYNKNTDMKLELTSLVGSTQAMLMECIFTSNDKTLLKYEMDEFKYGECTSNSAILNELHRGITDFASLYFEIKQLFDNKFELNSLIAFKALREKLNDFKYNYEIFKDFEEYQDSLPRYMGKRTKTTIGKIMKDRNLI